MARIQCSHVEGTELIDGKLITKDLSQAPDRDYSLGETKVSFVLCPNCAQALKAEIAKW
jgi:hypothetical protein